MITYSIEELHELLKSGQLDIYQYYDELFKEMAFQQERLNAFVTLTKDYAYKNLDILKWDGLLNHIPFVLKDNFSTKDIKTTASSQMLNNYIPVFNAHVVNQLYQHGAILTAKASMDELGMGNSNKTALTGPVRNPWDVNRIAGGSSGGSVAAVASGVVPFALGTDTGDSIRKPAGYCGVVGFKPTWGRISRYGVIPYASSLDHVGAITRNVRDMAIVIGVLSGRDDKDMTSSFKEVPHYLKNLDSNIQGIKIAVLKTVNDEVKNPKIKENFESILQILREKRTILEEVEIDKELLKCVLPTYTIIANCEALSNHSCLDGIKYGNRQDGQGIEDIMIQSRTHGFSSSIKRRFILGSIALASENQEKMFRKAQKVRRIIVDEVNCILSKYDIIITPNSGKIAPLLEEEEDRLSDEYIILENHLMLGNFTGTPCMSLPCGFVDNMPISIQLMGRLFEEQKVFNVAYALEEVLGFKNQYCKGKDKDEV